MQVGCSWLLDAFPQNLTKWPQKMRQPTAIIEFIQKKYGKWRTGYVTKPI